MAQLVQSSQRFGKNRTIDLIHIKNPILLCYMKRYSFLRLVAINQVFLMVDERQVTLAIVTPAAKFTYL